MQTNLLGTLLCTRAAMQALAAQKRGGHIFNMDGAGANNLPSPMYAAYGATKAGECPPSAVSYHSAAVCLHHKVRTHQAWAVSHQCMSMCVRTRQHLGELTLLVLVVAWQPLTGCWCLCLFLC